MSHITCTLFNSLLGVKPSAVPFNGTGPAMNALVGGQVDYMCDQIVNVVPQIKGGTIKAYAIATPERSPSLPDVPTTKEAGLPEFQVSAWNALFAPKGTPKDDRRQAQRRRSSRRSTTRTSASACSNSAASSRTGRRARRTRSASW